MARHRVAIVGAGIAGLTSALACAQDEHEVTVIERRTSFAEEGAGIQVSPNASRVLLALGLGSSLRRVAAQPEQVAIRSLRTGRTIGAVTLGSRCETLFGAPYWSIARADLHMALLDAVRGLANVRLRIGRDATALAQSDLGVDVTVRSESGTVETVSADLAVGADGIGSRLRASAGGGRAPRPTGFAAYRAVVPRSALPEELSADETGLWLGPGRHLVHYPIAAGRQVNLVLVDRERRQLDGWSAEVPREDILRRLAAAPAPLVALLAAASAWRGWSLAEVPAHPAGHGRLALVGDAAHPVLPYLAQGGALAIEDAAVLAAALREIPDVPEAVRIYAERRWLRVRRVQRQAGRNGRVYHLGWPLRVGRDLVIGRLGPDAMLERYGWLYGWSPPELAPS